MAPGGGMPQGGPQALLAALAAAKPPAPTHGETVAALRHFQAISGELRVLLSDPEVGRGNMKSKIIDGVTKLVSGRIISPSEAVQQLSNVPDAPFQQKQWLMQHMQQAQQAQVKVLSDHQQSHAGADETQMQPGGGVDGHMDDMKSLQSHYRPVQ